MGKLKESLNDFLRRGRSSLGIILKTNRAAKELYDSLNPYYDIQLIAPDSTRFTSGISITAISMSKGLEFDEVIVPAVSEETYHTEYDRGLLYVACTRAMHRLMLLYTGNPSPLLPAGQSGNRRM